MHGSDVAPKAKQRRVPFRKASGERLPKGVVRGDSRPRLMAVNLAASRKCFGESGHR